ncbi:MAG: hypothetical protein JW863_20675 [Chitinispirillaceae bacterium]|nr:hypothetical protein [Chitinispirillaceae bacterium]
MTGCETVRLPLEFSVGSTLLPGEFHGVPAGRIIAAAARFLNNPLISADTFHRSDVVHSLLRQ